ncbi:MAG: hypothetical protein A2912_03180 [Candidatus Buchananbacteria bacterium RIFCSPLOWO2_01_FULL_40_23b]|uniref:Uncharacterized protein n=1 Tax=Candidatus Buchananbacteria bacterium RIFCSPLOWO2_01_FULL_40_23b TaxID=1797544 RepID=A0A1G1YUB3_9BACT|nr:MAG: hypothetical protein A2912_03180 [Candidatus Buchananbacteria bacterium RIFCSPLOWO2_01_FULL_40_23b]
MINLFFKLNKFSVFFLGLVTIFAVTFFISASFVLAAWVGPSQPPPVSNLPGFIFNNTSPQSGANFNIAGNGTIGGNLIVSGTANVTGQLTAVNDICLGGVCKSAWPTDTLWTDAGAYIYPTNYNQIGITDTGSIGIGTTNPAKKLEVIGGNDEQALRIAEASGGTVGRLELGYNSASDYGRIQAWDQTATPQARNLILQPGGGNVGIGTTNPGSSLDVIGPSSLGTSAIKGSSDASSGAAVYGSATGPGGVAILGVSSQGNAGLFSGQVVVFSGNFLVVTGNVGIGTAAPTQKLEVNGAVRLQPSTVPATLNNGIIYYDSGVNKFKCYEDSNWKDCISTGGRSGIGGSGTLNYVAKFTPDGTTLGNSQIYDNGTNVGIGTINPNNKLDVARDTRTGTHATNQSLYITGSMTDGKTGPAGGNIEFRHSNATQGIGFGYNTIYQTGSNTNNELNFLSRGNGPITLNAYPYSTGNVGIGTAAPTQKLEVNGAVRLQPSTVPATLNNGIIYYDSGVNKFKCYEDSNWKDCISTGGRSGIGGSGTLNYVAKFTPNGTTLGNSQIYDNGTNVGIGSANPAEKLVVYSDTRSVARLRGDTNTNWVGTTLVDTAGSEKWFIGANSNNFIFRRNNTTNDLVISNITGNVGIGTAAPTQKLDVNGNVNIAGGNKLRIDMQYQSCSAGSRSFGLPCTCNAGYNILSAGASCNSSDTLYQSSPSPNPNQWFAFCKPASGPVVNADILMWCAKFEDNTP